MTITIHGRCWSCVNGIDASTNEPCEKCGGSGIVPVSRNDAFSRRKQYVGMSHPAGDKNTGWEKWTRMCTEVPPEVAQALDEAQRKSLGVNWDGYKKRPTTATHANLLRAALLKYLNSVDDEAEYVEAEAMEDHNERGALDPGQENPSA